jgi:hypothetical protein
MSQHIVTDDHGRSLFTIEVAQPLESPLRGGVDGFASTTADNVREVGQAIAKLCDDVMSSVKASITEVSPDELELSFGVSLGGEASIPLITKATSEATFTVRAVWRDHERGK